MASQRTLYVEKNVISLRTAYVADIGTLVGFRLNPADVVSLIPKARKQWAPKDFEWISRDRVWLYRHLMPEVDETKLMNGFPCVDQGIKPMSFEKPPRLKLIWTDSGNGVALCINGEPWAFIDETSHEGYSKGIINPEYGNPWSSKLFEKIFSDASQI